MIGSKLGPYRIEALLGEGGMGAVYRARDERLNRLVAVKVLSEQIARSPEARTRLVREARSLAAVHHPGIATLFGLESIDGCEMLVMELVEGMPLSAALREGPMDPARVRTILARICEALEVAHEHGIVHRDLKPDNLMLLPGDQVKILDFGLAVGADDTRITREGSTLGTVAYMSPEQARGEAVDSRSDLFSLGVVAAELVTGSRLFRGDSLVAVLRQIADLREPPAVDTDADLARFIASCLQPRPGKRPPSAASARAIIVPREPAQSGRGGSGPSRRWLGAGLVFVLAACIALAVALWPGQHEPVVDSPVGAGALAVVPFQNVNLGEDEAWFATAAAELLATTLSGSHTVSVISPERVRMIIGAGAGDPLAALATAGVRYSVTGSVLGGRDGIRVETRLAENASGELLHSVVGQASDVDGLYDLVARLDRSYRDFMEVRAISERLDEEWIQSLPTYSIEAYRAYARGREQLSAARWGPAIDFFREAVSIDSTFVSAWVDLSSSYWNLGDVDQMNEALSRAQALRDRASPRERHWLDLYSAVLGGDGPRIVQYASEMLSQEPEHRFVRYLLGKGYYEQGSWARAVEEWKPLREARWSWIWTYLYSSRALSRLGDFAAARAPLAELEQILAPADSYARVRLHRYRGLIHLDEGDYSGSMAEFDRANSVGEGYSEYGYDRARGLIGMGDKARARAVLQEYLSDPRGKENVPDAEALVASLD